jgi:hypothetical protein
LQCSWNERAVRNRSLRNCTRTYQEGFAGISMKSFLDNILCFSLIGFIRVCFKCTRTVYFRLFEIYAFFPLLCIGYCISW